jgi:hypothetical protein
LFKPNGTSESARPRIAIIGGGQSAKAVLFALAERLAGAAKGSSGWPGCEIVVLERSNEFGTGLAWSRRFALEAHQSSLATSNPRVVYGDGQIRQFAGCVDLLANYGVRVVPHPGAAVVGIAAHGGAYRIALASGAQLAANAVILATGYGTTGCVPAGHDGGHPQTGACRPWPAQDLQALARGNTGPHWLVLGGYLTAVDAVLTLALACGSFDAASDRRLLYRPERPLRITVASRTGCLPAVWGAPPGPLFDGGAALDELGAVRARYQGFLPLVELLALVDRALVAHGATGLLPRRVRPTLPRYVSRARALLRDRARDARATLLADLDRVCPAAGPLTYARLHRSALQAVLFAVLPIMSECFHELSAEDYSTFQREFRTAFFHQCMPMGLDSAMRLRALMDAGALDVLGIGHEHRLEQRGRGWQLDWRRGMHWHAKGFDQMVEAFGAPLEMRAPVDRLWRVLVDSGMVRSARLPFQSGGASIDVGGVDVEPTSCRVRAPSAGPALYAMGPLVFGLFLDAQGIAHSARDAARILDDLERTRWFTHPETSTLDGPRDSQTI